MVSQDGEIRAPSASRQIAFHQLLVAARRTWLMDALGDALLRVAPSTVKAQVDRYAPADAQQILAAAGVRDEHVFPTPVLLEAKPTLVGYYRLLLGVPQKTFYGRGTGMALFKAMERHGKMGVRQQESLPEFCRAMSAEKSHQKARNEGFRDFWTVIAKRGLDLTKLRRESPTTTSWFDVAQVLGRRGEDWDEFRHRLAGEVGIPTG